MNHYTIKQKRAYGIEWYGCKYCKYTTPSKQGIQIHLEQFHADKLSAEPSKAELIELAREHNLPIRGSKAEIEERLSEAGVL